eukprot:6928393-Prymnesium_polylepis.1
MHAPAVTGEREHGDAVERSASRFRGELWYTRVERTVRGVQQEDPNTQSEALDRTQGNTQARVEVTESERAQATSRTTGREEICEECSGE